MKSPPTHSPASGVIPFIAVCILAALAAVSCEKSENEPNGNEAHSHLRFLSEVDGHAVEFDTIKYVNEFGNMYSVETIRYFISRVEFIKASGEAVHIDSAVYVDMREEAYRTATYDASFPDGTYTAMRFTFGLDSAMNQTGAFPNFPEAAMEWPIPMGGGYHYMKLEGKYLDGESYNHFNFHTGPFDENRNYFTVEIPLNLEIHGGSFDVSLVMEIQNWFKDPNLFDLTSISGGMMGDQEIQEAVKANGHNVFHTR